MFRTRKMLAAVVGLYAVTLSAAHAGVPTTHDVSLGGMSFSPVNLTIQVGDTVRFTWGNFGLHDVVQTTAVGNCTAAPGGFMSGNFPGDLDGPGTVWELTIDEAFLADNPVTNNVYPYKCTEHCFFGMRGTITVEVPEPTCPADLTGDDSVGVPDLLALLSCWGDVAPGCEGTDLTGDETIGVPDLLALLGAWGPCD